MHQVECEFSSSLPSQLNVSFGRLEFECQCKKKSANATLSAVRNRFIITGQRCAGAMPVYDQASVCMTFFGV